MSAGAIAGIIAAIGNLGGAIIVLPERIAPGDLQRHLEVAVFLELVWIRAPMLWLE